MVGVVLLVIAILLYTNVVARRYKKVPPDQAMVVFGRKRGDRAFVVVPPGGAKFIVPIVEAHRMLSLEMHRLNITTPDTITRSGVPITVDLIALVRISSDPESLETAAVHWLSKPASEMLEAASWVIVGHTRGVCALLEVEQINADRDALSGRIRDEASKDFAKSGLEIVSLTVKDISDQVGYLEALGKRRTAEVKRDAIVAEATARKQAIRLSAEQDVESQKIRFKADAEIAAAQAERDAVIEASKKDATTRYARAK